MAGIDVTRGKCSSDELAATDDANRLKKPEQPSRSGKLRQRTLRFRLACLVLACVLPVCAIAGFVVYHAYQQKRQLMEQRVLDTARALSMVVDQKLAVMQASAMALATSQFLVSGDLAAFRRQAQAVLHDYPDGTAITLTDATGQQIVNTFVPLGTPLPKRVVWDQMQRVFETGKPVIINLFKGATTARLVAGIAVPVIHDGRVVHVLALMIAANHFEAVLSQQSIPPGWPATILDGNRVVVARDRLEESYIGVPAVPPLFKAASEAAEGHIETTNRAGAPIVTVFSRSAKSGWTVGIGIPKAVMLAGLRQWLWWTVGGALLLSMMGIALAIFLARRISGSIQSLIGPALALGTGGPVDVGQLDLAETNAVGQSLVKASQLLQQRTAERKRAESILQTTLQRFYAILSSMYSAVLLVTDEGRVEFANQAFCDRFGMADEPADLVGLYSGVMLEKIKHGYRHPDEALARIREVLGRAQPVIGEELAMQGEGTCLRDFIPLNVDGKSYGRLWLHMDISERKRAEEALLRSEKLASVGRMAATIAHEINNPLEVVTNALFIAKSAGNLPEITCQYLDIADAELKRIAHITRQSLGFYRESTAPALTSVHAVLESAVELLKSRIRAKGAVIEKQWDGDVEITAVAGELRQVFSNLLSNSLDAIDPKGTIQLRVSTGAAFKNGERFVRVTVADNGKGISAGSRQHLFEPFFTTKGTVGTGLGLWVSKQIVDKHGGTIRMRSSSDGVRRGTVFSVVLPVTPAAAASRQSTGV
jgi:signal transduction histidine kinase